MTTLRFIVWVLACIVGALARPHHPIRHARHVQRSQNENSNNNNNDRNSGEYNGLATIETCEVPNPCNNQGTCAFVKSGTVVCVCEPGYFGATCEIEPTESVRCSNKRNQANSCPLGQFCLLDDFRCFFSDCPDAKGFCVKEPNFASLPQKKQELKPTESLYDSAEEYG